MLRAGGWWAYMRSTDTDSSKRVTWSLVRRVMRYVRPYRTQIILLLILIVITTVLGLLTPLIFRDLIDNVIPDEDTQRLHLLAVGLVAIPVVSGGIASHTTAAQRYRWRRRHL